MKNRTARAAAAAPKPVVAPPGAEPNPSLIWRLQRDEANAVLGMIDHFVRTTGLQGAQQGVVLAASLEAAAVASWGKSPRDSAATTASADPTK